MDISATTRAADGFKSWSVAHPPGNDDDQPDGAKPIALTAPDRQAEWDKEVFGPYARLPTQVKNTGPIR